MAFATQHLQVLHALIATNPLVGFVVNISAVQLAAIAHAPIMSERLKSLCLPDRRLEILPV